MSLKVLGRRGVGADGIELLGYFVSDEQVAGKECFEWQAGGESAMASRLGKKKQQK